MFPDETSSYLGKKTELSEFCAAPLHQLFDFPLLGEAAAWAAFCAGSEIEMSAGEKKMRAASECSGPNRDVCAHGERLLGCFFLLLNDPLLAHSAAAGINIQASFQPITCANNSESSEGG